MTAYRSMEVARAPRRMPWPLRLLRAFVRALRSYRRRHPPDVEDLGARLTRVAIVNYGRTPLYALVDSMDTAGERPPAMGSRRLWVDVDRHYVWIDDPAERRWVLVAIDGVTVQPLRVDTGGPTGPSGPGPVKLPPLLPPRGRLL